MWRGSKMLFPSALVLLILFTHSSTDLVTWSPNRSFNLVSSFKDGNVPCSEKLVIFPESVQESVLIDSISAVNHIFLPSDGTILFDEGATLIFGHNWKSRDQNCTFDTSFYMADSSFSWSSPGVWNSSKFNKATPDSERLPCYDDNVVFPTSAQFTITLPDFKQYINGLTIGGRNLSTEEFMDRINSPSNTAGIQQYVLGPQLSNDPVIVSQEPCRSTVGCPCQRNGLKINCELKYCPTPKCANPIKPIGHCCKICGGNLLFHVKNLNMRAFKSLVKTIVNSYGAENFVYHIGVLPLTDPDTLVTSPRRVQVIVMDAGEYTGASSEVINEISYEMQNEWSVTDEKLIQMSGSPDSKTGLGGKIAVSMFFAVVIVMGVMFAYYYRRSGFKLPEMRGNIGAGVLSRFQRRSESVVTLTRRDSNLSGLRENIGATAFRNPLYDSKRGRVTVTESTLEE